MGYKFSREEIDRHKCLDCGVNVIEAGDYCMLDNKIWEGELGPREDDNVCIVCVEARLGRKLKPDDFHGLQSVEGFGWSDTLVDRRGFSGGKPQKKPRKR
jgi:hypothetical protein